MNIKGTFGTGGNTPSLYKNDTSGAFYNSGSNGRNYAGEHTSQDDRTSKISFEAARENGKHWTGKTSMAIDHSHIISEDGTHTHTASVESVGGGSAMNNMQPYLAVYMGKRTA